MYKRGKKSKREHDPFQMNGDVDQEQEVSKALENLLGDFDFKMK